MAVIRRVVDSTQDYTTDDPSATDPNAAVTDPTVIDRTTTERLPDVVRDPGSPPAADPTPNPTPNPTPTTTARTNYNPIMGWDVTKLNTPSVSDTKYNFGRAAEDYTGGYGRGNLQGLVDFYNTKYGGHAKVTGDDMIDFGESYGPIDVWNANNYLQWLVPGGDGGAGGGSGAGAGGGAASTLGDINSVIKGLMDSMNPKNTKSTAQPGSPGTFDPTAQQPVGDDPFSKLITDAYGSAIQSQLDAISNANQDRAANFEAARMPYEMARRSQMNNALADLANRGLLPEPGHLQGPEVTAINQIESGLAPAYTGAIANMVGQQDTAQAARIAGLGTLLAGANTRQGTLADIAIRNLEQNRLWQQFLTQYGLDATKVNADIANGNVTNYLKLLELWLTSANIAAGGFI